MVQTTQVMAARRSTKTILPPPPASVHISSTYTVDYTNEGKVGEDSLGKIFKATRKDSAAPTPPGMPRLVAVKRIEKEGLDEQHRNEVINEARLSGRGVREVEECWSACFAHLQCGGYG